MAVYCVTGGTGFIASHLIKVLLEKGHHVRTTARDPSDLQKVGFLWEIDGAVQRLRIFKADLMVDLSFDQAVDGTDGVFHTASPVVVPYDKHIQSTLIDPCIQGTMNVLHSCSRARTVKRVVLTSSTSAIRYREDAELLSPLNDSHWSDLEYCKRYNLWYPYAKTLGEKEAWRISKELGIDLVVVNPSFVIGPFLGPHPTSSLFLLLSMIKGVRGEFPNQRIGFVHIDDVVMAHMLSMEKEEASGRLVCSSSVAHWSEIMDMLKASHPMYPYESKCGNQEGDNIRHALDTTKLELLGLASFKTLHQMFDDCIVSFEQKGVLSN